MSTDRILELFDEIDRTPVGPHERALIDEAVALAVAADDEPLEYRARMRLTSSACMTGDTETMLTSFAWCLSRHDADPARFPADPGDDTTDLMWQFKWMADGLSGSPAFDRAQIDAVLEDMQTHYRTAGLGDSGVLMARFQVAWGAGRHDEAERLRTTIAATPRDSHSHCEACVRSVMAGFLIDTGRETEAIALIEELVEGGFTCGEEPEHALARSLVPYLRAGEYDKARAAHLRSYRLAKDNPDNLAIVAWHIVFCAITGNEARALSLIERHLDWLTHDTLNVEARFSSLSAFALALDAVDRAGHGDTPVRGSDAPRLQSIVGAHEGAWSAAALAAAMRGEAERLADDFDRRDGTDSHRRRLRERWALADERYELPLSDEPLLPRTTAVPAHSDEDRVRRALDLADAGATAEALAAADAAIAVAPPLDALRLEGVRVRAHLLAERTDEAVAALAARQRILHALGRDDDAQVEERAGFALFGRALPDDLATLRCLHDDLGARSPRTRAVIGLALAASLDEPLGDEAVDLLTAAFDGASAAGEDDLARSALATLASVRGARGELDECAGLITRILDDPATGAGIRSRLLALRARLHGAAQRFAEGAHDADEACRLLVGMGAGSLLSGVYVLAAALSEDAGAYGEAVARYRVAEQCAIDADEDPSMVRYRWARALLAAGVADEAADLLTTVFSDETERDEPAGSRAQTLSLLARALEQSGQPDRAVGAWEYAAELFDEAEAPAARAGALIAHGRLLSRFGEDDDAAASLETAVGLARDEPDDPRLLADALHTWAQVHAARGDDTALPLLDEAHAVATGADEHWLAADITDSRARALAMRERHDDAVATALQAADAFAALGDAGSAGASELFAARVLGQASRADDAVPIYRSVIERAAGIPSLQQVAAGELGDALESLGRPAEAAEARALLES